MEYVGSVSSKPDPHFVSPAASATVPSLAISLEDAADLALVETAWRDLEGRSQGTFFTSWDWIGCWLRLLPDTFRPRLLKAMQGATVVGLAFLVPRREKRYRVLPCRRWHFNETGDPHYDQLMIEYNDLLVDESLRPTVNHACLTFLADTGHPWDEIVIRGVSHEHAMLTAPSPLRAEVRDQQPSYFVDLHVLRDNRQDYLSALSANTRQQIRRALRDARQHGAIELIKAESTDQAMEFFAELKRLHQSYWIHKGQPGAFANPWFTRFHETLVQQGVARGTTELLKITAGQRILGYLYNLVHNGHVCQYQSGFDYLDQKLKPGVVSHYRAVEHYLTQGATVYDFLSGDSQYKRSLSTHATTLVSAVLRRRRKGWF